MDGSEIREPLAGEAEEGNGLGLVPVGRGSGFEAFLREIGAAIEANELLGVGFNVVEYLTKELVGQFEDAHCGTRKPFTAG